MSVDEILAALEAAGPDLREALQRANDRDREGGEPLAEFLDELDELFPELAELCNHAWALELLLRLCRMRSRR